MLVLTLPGHILCHRRKEMDVSFNCDSVGILFADHRRCTGPVPGKGLNTRAVRAKRACPFEYVSFHNLLSRARRLDSHFFGKMPVMTMRGPHPCGPPGVLVTQHLMEPPKLTGCFPNLTT